MQQEDALSDIAKKAGGFALGAIIGKGGSKFGGLDIKRVYFGQVFSCEIIVSKILTLATIGIGYVITVRYVYYIYSDPQKLIILRP